MRAWDDLLMANPSSFPMAYGQFHDCITDYGMNTETAKNLAVAGKKRKKTYGQHVYIKYTNI